MSDESKWIDAGNPLELWLCRECGATLSSSGKLFSIPGKYVALDVDGGPICLCFRCWASLARRSVATENWIGTLRQYHERQAIRQESDGVWP